MKKLILILLFATVTTWAADIDFTFDYSYATPGCVDAATVNCVESFEVRDKRDGAVVATVAAAPSTTPVTGITTTAFSYPKVGNRTFEAFAIARDEDFVQIESLASVSVSVVIRPSRPENVGASQR